MRAVLIRGVLPTVSGGPRALQHPDLVGMLPGGDVDAVVGQHHQEEGNVEGHHRAGNGVWLVDHEYAVGGVGSLVELPLLDLGQGEKGEGQRMEEIQCCSSAISSLFVRMLYHHFPILSPPFPLPYALPLLPLPTMLTSQALMVLRFVEPAHVQLQCPGACLNLAAENQPNSPVHTL